MNFLQEILSRKRSFKIRCYFIGFDSKYAEIERTECQSKISTRPNREKAPGGIGFRRKC